ncbi:MAG: phage replisome organizer N-terminal domain-containing protein [Clostridia bacterium]|nr:phage replisome organizer N-terminal domain-containing protein [Clostridia bacterium]
MTQEKKYYWLRLCNDFFSDKVMKKLRKSERGDTCIVIYLKILLTAIQSGGVIEFIHLENSFAEELALELDEAVDDVNATLDFLFSVGLVQTEDNISFFFPEALDCTGSESAATRRSRESRERRKAQQCNTNETAVPQSCNSETRQCRTSAAPVQQKCRTEIEKEKEIEKEIEIEKKIEKDTEKKTEKDIAVSVKSEKLTRRKYGEYKNVLLSDEDLQRLKTEFPSDWSTRIERLSSYMASSGKAYKNHLATIRSWASSEKEKAKEKEKPTGCFNDGLTLNGLI